VTATTLATATASPPASDLAAAARETSVVWAGLFALGVGFGVLVTGHEIAGVAATVAVHAWRRNVVLSLVAATAVCLVLANGVLA
jgi:hypothetical protein